MNLRVGAYIDLDVQHVYLEMLGASHMAAWLAL